MSKAQILKHAIYGLLGVAVVCATSSLVYAKDSKSPGSPLDALKYRAGDEDANDRRAVHAELLVSKSEKLAIQQLNKLLKKYKGHPMEPDLWYRLAELYMRRANSARFFEIYRDSKVAAKLIPPEVRKASARKYIWKAVGIYDRIERRFPKFVDIDLVLFNNAFARQQLGKNKLAEALYWKVIKNYSNSQLVPDSHLAIGEMAFDSERFKFALEHFTAIKKYPEAKVYPYGLYKGAWTYYNLHQADRGLAELEKVVAYGKYVHDNNIEAKLDLRREALADMTLFYEDIRPASQAFSYFKEQASELDMAPYILKLAALYKIHSRFKDKEIILQQFVREIPMSETLPEVHQELVWNYESMQKRGLAVRQMERFHDTCEPKSKWSAQFLNDPKKLVNKEGKKITPQAISSCKTHLKSVSLKLAGKWWRRWKKETKNIPIADASERAFQIYLQNADDSKEAIEARFAYAELLFQRKKYRVASINYEKVGQLTKEEKLGHDARYASLLSLEKAVGDKWKDEDEKKFFSLVADYAKHHPKGEYRLDLEFKVGLINYEKERYDQAAPVFKRLGEQFAKTEKGLKSQDLYLDILNHNKDYKGLKEYAAQLKGKGGDDKRVAKLTNIYREAYFLEVQGMEDAGETTKAIAGYKSFAKENKTSPLAEKAWWNAVQLHFKSLDFKDGAAAAVQFYDMYPKSKQASDALLRAAQTYESMAQLKPASAVLLKLAEVDKKSAEKWKLLAADFYLLSQQPNKATRLYNTLKSSQDKTLAMDALHKLELIEKDMGNEASYRAILREVVKTGHQPQASLAQLVFLEDIFAAKRYPEAFSMAKEILNMGSSAATKARARARFIQASILEDEFRNQSVKTRMERVALVLQLKTGRLEKAQQAYEAAIRYGDPHVSIESLMRLADCYSHYAEALRTMPSPEGLPASDEPAFRAEIQQLIIPMEEKGVETLADALNQAKKLQLHDETVARIQQKLNQVNFKKDHSLVEVTEPTIVVPGFQEVGT